MRFNIEKPAPDQASIDGMQKEVSKSFFIWYLLALVITGTGTASVYQQQGNDAVLVCGGLISAFIMLIFCGHLSAAAERIRSFQPIEDDGLGELADFFKSDKASPEVMRYRREVIEQGRQFCSAEFSAIKAFQVEWMDRCRIESLRADVYSVVEKSPPA